MCRELRRDLQPSQANKLDLYKACTAYSFEGKVGQMRPFRAASFDQLLKEEMIDLLKGNSSSWIKATAITSVRFEKSPLIG